MVQVPEDPKDKLYMFLMEHREWICSLIQADRLGWDDRLFSTLRHVLEYPRPGVENGGVHEPVPQHPQDMVDQTMGEFLNQIPSISRMTLNRITRLNINYSYSCIIYLLINTYIEIVHLIR